MTVEEFLEKLNYRQNKQWFRFGNDISYELYLEKWNEFESTFDFEKNANELDDKYFTLIGRVLCEGNKNKVYTDADYLKIAKEKLIELGE